MCDDQRCGEKLHDCSRTVGKKLRDRHISHVVIANVTKLVAQDELKFIRFRSIEQF
jgi:hypothetical protein